MKNLSIKQEQRELAPSAERENGRMKSNVLLTLMFSLLFSLGLQAQNYNIQSAGQGKNGSYLVEVSLTANPKEKGYNPEDLVTRYAVHGVMFRGVPAADGYGEQKPLIKDPNVEQTKADFFNAFFGEGAHRRYASIVNSSLTSTKISKKQAEISAILLVDKESLQQYLEKSGIIKGFSNLW